MHTLTSALTEAERYAADHGWVVVWEDDWLIGDHAAAYGGEAYADGGPETCESAILYDKDRNVLAALSCIDDANNEYRRAVEVDLMSEALYEIQQRKARKAAGREALRNWVRYL